MGFRGFDSSIILIKRVGIPRSIGKIRESLSQAMLVGVMSLGRLGVCLEYGTWEPLFRDSRRLQLPSTTTTTTTTTDNNNNNNTNIVIIN